MLHSNEEYRGTHGNLRLGTAHKTVCGNAGRTKNPPALAVGSVKTSLVRDYDLIAIETLMPKNMVKNRRLAKAISDAAWGEIVRQLEYKCNWYGKELVKVDRFYPSSQTCNSCGFKNSNTKNLAVREWDCPKCGAHHDRDVNAAKNILDEGLRILNVA